MRCIATAIAIALLPSYAPAKNSAYFCQFEDTEGVVRCVKAGDANPVFTHVIAAINIIVLSSLSSVPTPTASTAERCRLRTEQFREEEIEGTFRPSIEGLRSRAEDIRDESQNIDLYNQIMNVYYALLGRYQNGLSAYREAIRTCSRVTPYETRPNRFGGRDGRISS